MGPAGQVLDGVALFIVLESRSLSPFGLSIVQHHVHGEPVQPGAECALAAKQVQLFPRSDEDVLRQLLGARPAVHHPGAEGEDPRDVQTVQPFEGTTISRSREADVWIGGVRRYSLNWFG